MTRLNTAKVAFSMTALCFAAGCGGAPLGSPRVADIDAARAAPNSEFAQVAEQAAPAGAPGSPTPAPEPHETDGAGVSADDRRAPADETGDVASADEAGESDAPSNPDSASPPLLVYTAQVTLAALDAEATVDRVEQIALDRGGYLLSRDDHSITVRVPAPDFTRALEAVEDTGDVVTRNVQALDVTEEVRDLRVRLDNARAMRKRLEQLLERANDVKSALTVERELERIAVQIERLTGRLKRLGELISFSTLTVRVTEQPKERVNKEGVRMPFSWLGELGLVRLLDLGAGS